MHRLTLNYIWFCGRETHHARDLSVTKHGAVIYVFKVNFVLHFVQRKGVLLYLRIARRKIRQFE